MSRDTDTLKDAKQQCTPELYEAIKRIVDEKNRQQKFGLVWEEHNPEVFEIPHGRIYRGTKVRVRSERGSLDKNSQIHTVTKIKKVNGEKTATVKNIITDEFSDHPLDRLIRVVTQDEEIYPGLELDGEVVGDPDNNLYHTVINGENYDVLRMLNTTHHGKIDAIYIDPPYNTGNRDWKYNNDYVDGSDQWRSSAFMNFLGRRLLLAKELLNPEDSVLILTIDEKEYLNVGKLLHQTFPEARIQMVSSVINPAGSARRDLFSRAEEYIYFVLLGDAKVSDYTENMLVEKRGDGSGNLNWDLLRRRGKSGGREHAKNLFYPLIFSKENGDLLRVGEALPHSVDKNTVVVNDNEIAIFPIDDLGNEKRWGINREKFLDKYKKGYIKINRREDDFSVYHLQNGAIEKVENGTVKVLGKEKQHGTLILSEYEKTVRPLTMWNKSSHNASVGGTTLTKNLFGEQRFDYPKSLYAVEDALRFFVKNKPEATILDFFGGSGTTAHAVMRLNKQDGGKRKAIIVTNNEIGEHNEKKLTKQGIQSGDKEWESLGICQYVTKPRIQAAITGKTAKSNFTEPVKGAYKYNDEFPMSEGLKQNARFFTLRYVKPQLVEFGDENEVNLLLPLLWLAAGQEGSLPTAEDLEESGYYVSDSLGVLWDSDYFAQFVESLPDTVRSVFVLNDTTSLQKLAQSLPVSVSTTNLWHTYFTRMRSQKIIQR